MIITDKSNKHLTKNNRNINRWRWKIQVHINIYMSKPLHLLFIFNINLICLIVSYAYRFDIGFGPLGTSWASTPNSFPAPCFWGLWGWKVVEVDEDDMVDLEEVVEEGFMVDVGWWDKLMMRRRMRKSVRKWKKLSCFEVLDSAMQFERKIHPPRDHKGSISINQLHQGYGGRWKRKNDKFIERGKRYQILLERERERKRKMRNFNKSDLIGGIEFDEHLSKTQY